MQLAIDVSSNIAGLALSDKDRFVAEVVWHCGQNHTVELLPSLIRLLEQGNVRLQDISGIAVAKGPGSFNALRVGISTASGLSLSLGIPVVGISTLEIEAWPFAFTGLMICPIHNAGRGEIAAATYQYKMGEWCQIEAEHITTIDALCSKTNSSTLFCGELSPAMESQIVEALEERAIIPSQTVRLRRPEYLCDLGWMRLQRHEFDDPATLQPSYLRKPPITQPRDKSILR